MPRVQHAGDDAGDVGHLRRRVLAMLAGMLRGDAVHIGGALGNLHAGIDQPGSRIDVASTFDLGHGGRDKTVAAHIGAGGFAIETVEGSLAPGHSEITS